MSDPDEGLEIVTRVSHELRSPLTSLKGFTSLLCTRWDTLDDTDRRMMVQQVHKDAGRVSRMIAELLDVARMETGKISLSPQALDVGSTLQAAIDDVREEFPDIEVLADVSSSSRAVADPSRTQQVMCQLLENACKHAPGMPVHVASEVGAGTVTVVFEDEGSGLPDDDPSVVFDKEYRSRESRPSGIGLGLWLCKQLAELQGGSLSAANGPRGAMFRLTLPADVEE